jgi:hypothetical protein
VTNIKTGDQQSFPFDQNTDMRFMTGTFVGTDRIQPIAVPTSRPVLPPRGVEVQLTIGTAKVTASKVPVYDYGTLQNATSVGSNPPPVPGWVSFKVVWTGGVTMMPVASTDPTKGIFSGTFAQAPAQMEWQAAAGDFSFQSDPLETSQSTFAEICQETNGSYLTT